jgi:hypothetical protein
VSLPAIFDASQRRSPAMSEDVVDPQPLAKMLGKKGKPARKDCRFVPQHFERPDELFRSFGERNPADQLVHPTFRDFTKQRGVGFALKRLLINRDPLALWLWRNRKVPKVTIQHFIPGRPANTMFVAREGEVLSSVTVEVISSQGATGAATVVRLIQNAEISEAVHLLARKLKLNGFHGLDFMLEEGSGAAYLLELNPRCTQLGHLRIQGQGDLAGVLTAALRGINPPAEDDCITEDTIAFLTQASLNSPHLRGVYHDAPWQEPELLSELLREPWPDRQLVARAWHFFRPPEKPKEVRFENSLLAEAEEAVAEPAESR